MNIKTILVTIFIITGVLTATFYNKISTMLYTATGFSAKNICSGYFISNFSTQSILEEALIPVDKAFSFVDVNVNDKEQSIETSFYGGFSRKAFYNQGIGCTLLAINQDELAHKVEPLAFTLKPNDEKKAWPIGEGDINTKLSNIDYLALTQALNKSFEEPLATTSRRTKAVVVIYKGQLIAEQYASGVNKNTPLLSWSMAKSVTNLQVGLLVNDGLVDIYQSANVPSWTNKPDYQQITLDQLLRMSSGLSFAETYGGASDAPYMLSIAPNASEYAENKEITHKPDTFWSYSSGTSNILSGIIKRTIGGDFQQYYQYTQEKLFKPLNIKSAQLEADSSGIFVGSSYVYATARDWAKLGQLMLQDGLWEDQRILPEGWVEYSSSPTKTDPLNNYGAQFWLNGDPKDLTKQRKWPTVPNDAYSMNGYQGQYVVMIPSKDLVIARFGFTTPGADKGIEALLAEVIKAIK